MKKIYFIIIGVLLIGWSSDKPKCKQWNGNHQQFKFALVEGRIYAECGSCGDLIPIRSDYDEEAIDIISANKIGKVLIFNKPKFPKI